MRSSRSIAALAVAAVAAATACTAGAGQGTSPEVVPAPASAAPSPDVAAPGPAAEVAQLSVVRLGLADGPGGQAQVKVLPEVVATADVEVRTTEADFWLMVDPGVVDDWSGLPDQEAWTTRTPDGSWVGMIPVNPSGMSQRTDAGRTFPTRWDQWSVAPGTSSLDPQEPPGALVFSAPEREDGSLGLIGLALLDANREPVAVAPVDDWPGESDPTTF